MFGLTSLFKHLRSYRDGAYLWYFDQCDTTQECHVADTGHDTPPCHSIQAQCRPVVVLSIDVERHTGIHNYPFLMSCVRLAVNSRTVGLLTTVPP